MPVRTAQFNGENFKFSKFFRVETWGKIFDGGDKETHRVDNETHQRWYENPVRWTDKYIALT